MRKRQKIKLPPKLRQAVKRAGKPVKGVTKKGGGKSGKKKKNPIEAMKEDFRRKFKRIKWSRVFRQAIPYIVFGYFCDVIGCAYRVTNAADFFNRLLGAINNLGVVMSSRIVSLHPVDLFAGIVFGAGLRAVVYFKGKNAKKFRKGEEYGSARWGAYYQL